MIVLKTVVLHHLDTCQDCRNYSDAYVHVHPEYSSLSFEEQLIKAMTEPIKE